MPEDMGITIRLDAASAEALADAISDRLAKRLSESTDSHPHELGWLNPAGAAEYLGISRRRVYDLKSSGRLPPDGHDGRIPLWRRESLDGYARDGLGTAE